MISKRAQAIDSSGIRRVFDLAAKLENPINLSIGQPDFDAFPEVREGAKAAIDSEKSGYTVTQGIQQLREGILDTSGYTTSAGENEGLDVIVTAGVSGGLMLSYLALLDPGDEILIPDPFFCIYRDLATMVSANAVYYDTYPDFKTTAERIEASITPATKAILVNSPGNPTGVALTQDELDDIIQLAKRKDLWLIYDEIYSAFTFDFPHARCDFAQHEKTIVLNGFSKSHGVPGWRLGYALGPELVLSEMKKLQQYSFVCAPSVLQHGITHGLHAEFDELRESYRRRRDFVFEALSRTYKIEKPTGAFYLFPEAPGGVGQEFVERCIASNLLVVPGNVFSTVDSHFRISFSASMEVLEKGVETLLRLGV